MRRMTVRRAWKIFNIASVVFTASVVLTWQDHAVSVMRWIAGIYVIIALNAILHSWLARRRNLPPTS